MTDLDILAFRFTGAGHEVIRGRRRPFGDVPNVEPPAAWITISMPHVVQFLQTYLRGHWDVLRHVQIKDPAFGVLALIEKWGVLTTAESNGSSPERRSNAPV